jgi:hypothetical protein
MGFAKEFKTFTMRGNVMDMAAGKREKILKLKSGTRRKAPGIGKNCKLSIPNKSQVPMSCMEFRSEKNPAYNSSPAPSLRKRGGLQGVSLGTCHCRLPSPG